MNNAHDALHGHWIFPFYLMLHHLLWYNHSYVKVSIDTIAIEVEIINNSTWIAASDGGQPTPCVGLAPSRLEAAARTPPSSPRGEALWSEPPSVSVNLSHSQKQSLSGKWRRTGRWFYDWDVSAALRQEGGGCASGGCVCFFGGGAPFTLRAVLFCKYMQTSWMII